MADDRSDLTDPTDEVPEADRLEQSADATPVEDGEPVDAMGSSLESDADPADRQEQLTPVADDDEDYPHS